ncbi:phage head-tail connector protein [Cytobacillus sp. IB215665]|uniref:phage head-tail connector protein n=1 Tax=Cytobacillus sp. IB215665 TaxID=3097357 RepID=UPI002A0F2F9E|nr:phage head-tail connector protein [Cytobacillus sp. IB215665]MDX8367854.1 phage head-tail connector protein [Cytobacillus sp. IB215665]
MLSKLKIYLGINDDSQDDLLTLLLDMANDIIKAYCYCSDEELATIPDYTKIRIASALHKKRRGEGLKARNQGSRSTQYDDILSDDIKLSLNQYRRVRGAF